MKPWMKTLLRRTAWTVGGSVLAIAAVHGIENWRGQQAWKAWLAARAAAGEPTDLNAFAPPAVADADNFAKAPLVEDAVLGRTPTPNPAREAVTKLVGVEGQIKANGWRDGRPATFGPHELADAEAWLKEAAPLLQGWSEAARRLGCRMMANYADTNAFPAYLGFRAVARAFRTRALVALRRGQGEAALQDLETLLRITRHLQAEPHLLAQLLRLATVGILVQPLWEGLEGHAWSEPQLARLEAALGPQDLLASMTRSLSAERISFRSEIQRHSLLELWKMTRPQGGDRPLPRWQVLSLRLMPSGWREQNLLTRERTMLALGEGAIDLERYRAAAGTNPVLSRAPYSFLTSGMLFGLTQQVGRAAFQQGSLDLARVAIALERHRLSHRTHPPSLEALVPAYLPSVPKDLCTGEPLRYGLKGDGSYTLYAVGWDGKDDGGMRGAKPSDATAPGDWVWR